MCNTSASLTIVKRTLFLVNMLAEIEEAIGKPSVNLGNGQWSDGSGQFQQLGFRRGRARNAQKALNGQAPDVKAKAEARAREQGIATTTVLRRDLTSAQNDEQSILNTIKQFSSERDDYNKELKEIYQHYPELGKVSVDDLQLHIDSNSETVVNQSTGTSTTIVRSEPAVEDSANPPIRLAMEAESQQAHDDELTRSLANRS